MAVAEEAFPKESRKIGCGWGGEEMLTTKKINILTGFFIMEKNFLAES